MGGQVAKEHCPINATRRQHKVHLEKVDLNDFHPKIASLCINKTFTSGYHCRRLEENLFCVMNGDAMNSNPALRHACKETRIAETYEDDRNYALHNILMDRTRIHEEIAIMEEFEDALGARLRQRRNGRFAVDETSQTVPVQACDKD